MGLDSKHPLVQEIIPPVSAREAVAGGDAEPVPVILQSATPRIAQAQSNLEAERLDGGEAKNGNARERALAGHRAPDTVDLPEAQIRVEDNARALAGSGGSPVPAKEAIVPERPTTAKRAK